MQEKGATDCLIKPFTEWYLAVLDRCDEQLQFFFELQNPNVNLELELIASL